MFTKSVRFYDALYHFKDYGAACRQLHALIQDKVPGAKTLLDVACGTGKHLEQLREHYQVEGLDISSEMLEVAHGRCPDVPLHQANMADFNLDHCFDVVTCLFSSIAYVKTPENLRRSISCMVRHLNPGGMLVIEPWFSPETYWIGRLTANFVDEPDLKIAWMYTSAIEGRCSVFDINYLVGTPEGISYFTERHEFGLFTPEEYQEPFRQAGLDVSYDPKGLFGRGMYVGVDREAHR